MPIRFGPVGLTPTLSITNFGVDSNIFNDSSDPKSDFTLTVTPKIDAKLRTSRALWSGSLASGLVYFKRYSDERSIDYAADGRVDLDLDWLRPYTLAKIDDTHQRLNAELDIRAPRTQTTLAAGARAVVSPKIGLVTDVRQATVQFAEGVFFEGVPLSRTLNSDIFSVEAGMEVYLTPLTTLSVTASRQNDRFDKSPERDSDSFRIMPTIKMEAPAIIQGSLSVGYRKFSPLSPELPDYSGVVATGSLSHTFMERMKVDLVLSRDVQYSFELNQPYYLTTGVRVTTTFDIRDDLDVRFIGGRERLEYREEETVPDVFPDTTRVDRADILDVGGGYRLRPSFRLGIDVEHARRLSDRPGREYRRTRVFGTISYGF
jgi:Putative beta-barrel porin 2